MTAYPVTGRIVLPYTTNGITHRVIHHVRGIALQGAAYYINTRTLDANDMLWTDACDGIDDAWGAYSTTTTSFGTFLLQELTGGVWVTLATHASSASAGGSAYNPATQLTLTLRDKTFKKVRVVYMEPTELSLAKVVTPTGGGTDMDAFVSRYTGTHANAKDAFNWQVSVWNQYLALAPFVSVTMSLNRKMRRARGYL